MTCLKIAVPCSPGSTFSQFEVVGLGFDSGIYLWVLEQDSLLTQYTCHVKQISGHMSVHGVVASQKILCGIMGMHHPQSCTELCFQENLGTGEGTALTTARIQGFQTI